MSAETYVENKFMGFTCFTTHRSPGGDTTVNMTVWNTTCRQLSDDELNGKCLSGEENQLDATQ
jgi:hypothetical protein